MGDAHPAAGLHLCSSGRLEDLVARLAGVLEADPLDPMEAEWLAVPSDGMRRWVHLELARHLGASGPGRDDGVAANFRRAYPGTLRNLVLDASVATEGGEVGADPWHIDAMVWPLLAVFDDLVTSGGIPEFTTLPPGGSRFTRVRAVADLFDRYHLHRPEMIRAWASPERAEERVVVDLEPFSADTAWQPQLWDGPAMDGTALAEPAGEVPAVDGTLEPISADTAWQPRLWRLLREEIGVLSPPERMADVLGRVRSDGLDLDLPRRLLLFGFTSLPGRDFLPLVEAVGQRREVHLFLLEPHRFDLGALQAAWPASTRGRPRLRADDHPEEHIGASLLRSWGRLPRESALLLADGIAPDYDRLDWASSGPSPRATLLERLQADIREDAEPQPAPVQPTDRSVQFHACFGATRQVQVARDAILHILSDADGALTEEDVLVVCPDLERFAPLVEAEFGQTAARPVDLAGPPALRYRIADRSMRSANPVLGATSDLLELVAGRFEITKVLTFLSLAPVRTRFSLDDDDLDALAEWAEVTNVRWGLDTGHRSRFGLPISVVANTWQAAVDRLVLGSAVADTDLDLAVGGVAPFGVDGSDVELLGTLGFVLEQLAGLAALAGGDVLPIGRWMELVRQTCLDLFAAPQHADWQFEALERVLRDVVGAAGASSRGADVRLDLLDVRRLLDGRLDESPGRPDFFRGGVTVTSLASLRWVPFRVICILGLDQESLGASAPDAADLIAKAPQPGDPDQRSEGRQRLLEAVLAAGDHLLVVREGRDVRSGHEVPRVVPLAELFDAVVALHPPSEQPRVRSTFEIEHPRHPFDEACLVEGGLRSDGRWSFATRDLDGAARRRSRPFVRPMFLDRPMDATEEGTVDLEDLRAFLRDPVATFVRRTLEAGLPRPANEVRDVLPVDLDGLERYRIGQNLLDARLRGADDQTWRRVERAKGTLPPGVLEDRLFDEVSDEVHLLLGEAATRGIGRGTPDLHEIDVTAGGGARIVGTVPLTLELPRRGPGRILFTRPKELNRLEAWLDLMVLVADDPTVDWCSVVVTRGTYGTTRVQSVELVPAATLDVRAMAHEALSSVVRLYRKGLTEPLPLFPTYSPALHDGSSTDGKWVGHLNGGDGAKPAVRLVFGDVDVDEIDELPPVAGDPDGPGSRVERYARHLWGMVGSTSELVT